MDDNIYESSNKPTIRLSERRGCGSFTLVSGNHLSASKRDKRYSEKAEGKTTGNSASFDERKSDTRPSVPSVTGKLSYFRLLQQQDGAETNIVTVEELSRDSAPAGLSPASSPSSKYRAPLPGCSPRWPHTYYHGTIFSFSSLPSCSVSPPTSYQRRRLFRPFASAELFTYSHYSASRRLSTVVETPVGDALIEGGSPNEKCSGFVSVEQVRLQNSSIDLNKLPLVVEEENLPIEPLLQPPDLFALDRRSLQASSTGNKCTSTVTRRHYAECRNGLHQRFINLRSETSTSIEQCNCEASVVDLLCNHHQQTAHFLDNNRTTSDFSTNRACFVSLNSGSGSCLFCRFHSKSNSACCVQLNSDAKHSCGVKKSSSQILTVSCDDLYDSEERALGPSCYNNLNFSQTMDKHNSLLSNPAGSGEASASHGPSVPSTFFKTSEVMQSDSVSSAAVSELTTAARKNSKVCKSHLSSYKKCNSNEALSEDNSLLTPPLLDSRCASPTTTVSESSIFEPDEKPYESSHDSSVPGLPGYFDKSRKLTPEKCLGDVFRLPDLPGRSRSPKEIVNCNSKCEDKTQRIRRLLSADRSSSDRHSSGVSSVSDTSGHTVSNVDCFRKGSVSSTKVERLRQLTQLLRPSSYGNPEPFQSSEIAAVSDQTLPISVLIPKQLPPIPVAPPRHPRTRSERKKSPRIKKDSATSTSDLALPETFVSSDSSQHPSSSERGSCQSSSIESTSDVINGDPFCLENSGEVKLKGEPPFSLKLNSPSDRISQQQNDNIFSSISLNASSNQEVPSNNDDIFDEVHYTVSKLNPRIMVGTYQQRTIPFRSASFSQIDVGADGTYNRRPRTSITLKPVTYSIGKDPSRCSDLQHSASLPRRLKINDQRSQNDESNNQTLSSTESSLKENSFGRVFLTTEPATENTKFSKPVLNTSIEENDNHSSEMTQSNTDGGARVSFSEDNSSFTDLDGGSNSKGNQQISRKFSSAFSDQSEFFQPSFESSSSDEHVNPTPSVDLLSENSFPIESRQSHFQEESDCSELKENLPSNLESDSTANDKIQLGNNYKTTEISISAEIRLSPLPSTNLLVDSAIPQSSDNLDEIESLPSKPLPVLDLLELNNHLLRLRAATRDSALDHLVDAEVAKQFEPPIIQMQSAMDTFVSSLNGELFNHDTSNQSENSRPWLNDKLRRTSNFEKVTGGWNSSGKDYETAGAECCPVGSAVAETLTTNRELQNKRSPRQGKRHFKRRRHSSFLTNTCSLGVHAGNRTKSTKGRSLTFPIVWSTNNSVSFGQDKSVNPGESYRFGALEETGCFDNQELASVNGCVEQGKSPTLVSFSDCFESLGDNILIATTLDEGSCVPTDQTTSVGSIGHSSISDNFLAESNHFNSIDSDGTENLNLVKASLLQDECEVENSQECIPIPQRENSTASSDHQNETNTSNQRLTVSLSVTLAPENQDQSSFNNLLTLSPYCSELDGNVLTSSPEKIQRSPLNPRRYGVKRRPLRGPYGEMLEAEMNKSEFSKMYAKRTEDLNFLRELNPRVNRDAKSSSPRPLSPSNSNGMHVTTNEAANSNWPNVVNSVRPSTIMLPASHSLDDSQLKIGYTSTAPIEITSSPRHSRHGNFSKRKTTPNFQYELYDDKNMELKTSMVDIKLMPECSSSTQETGEIKSRFPPSEINSSVHMNSVATPCHQRTSSSPCQLVFSEGGFHSEDEPELLELTSLASLTRNSDQLIETTHSNTLPVVRQGSVKRQRDTRTHAIGELYDTERSYVESLQILVTKYLKPLKSPEYSGLVESNLVDEIFFQIPAILAHHEVFLEELRKRLELWDSQQCVGGVFLETLTKPAVIETYTTYVNHWKHAKEAIKSACTAKSAFSKFLEATAREHKGKLALDSLLIMPVQRIPRYELLIKMLLKHTSKEHPDHGLLLEAQKEVHELAVKINCVEREAYGAEQQQATLRELEMLVEGLGPGNLAIPERIFIRHDCVTIPSALGTRKERGFFLFSDLLVITSVKRRNTAIRKTSSYSTSSIAGTLEANKFKLLMRVPLDDLEVTKGKEDGSKRSTKEFEHLEEDLILLNQITELASSLHVTHLTLDEALKEIHQGLQRQLIDKQNVSVDSQMATIDLAISTQDGTEILSVAFVNPEKRASWEDSFNETKLRLRAMSPERRLPPEFLMPLPIRKTRAGLQFTCAAPTVTWNAQQHINDVWVCNSDGYVGQVCILSLHPEPNVTSCNGVCNARITCIAAIPASSTNLEESTLDSSKCAFKIDYRSDVLPSHSISSQEIKSSLCANFGLESDSSSDSSSSEESGDEDNGACTNYRSSSVPTEVTVPQTASEDLETSNQATMWLGTEDGCIHIYHCGENIRLKKNRTRIQQGAAVLSIVYMDSCVFASLANGDVLIFQRSSNGGSWNINEPQCVTVGSIIGPVTRMLPVSSGLWCTSQNTVRILNTNTLSIEDQFAVSSDSQKSVLSLASNGLGVWVAMQSSAVIRLFHAYTHECICDVNLAPAVNKMLSGCDDIIRQHKAACLRVTSMMVCRDLLWVGTSAGVILTIPIPHLTPTSSRLSSPPCVTGLSHGHTGHVRFLTCVEASRDSHSLRHHSVGIGIGLKNKDSMAGIISPSTNISNHLTRLLVISGGDGYEDFRHGGFSDSVGREDSTNHLLLWQV